VPRPSSGKEIRIATFNVSLGRKGPGLLVRDLERGKDPQIKAVVAIIAQNSPDILLLSGLDYDYGAVALTLFIAKLENAGAHYPYFFAKRPNSGLQSGLDLDGDGKTGGPGDAQGYGRFAGSNGMAIVSRLEILPTSAKDFSTVLWRDLPGASLPLNSDGSPFPSAQAQSQQRLSSKGHWDVPVRLDDGRVLHILASNPSPPVFDGPEDRNGKRNRDEIRFWSDYILSGRVQNPTVLLGDLNADPRDGEGAHGALHDLLARSNLNDPVPVSTGAQTAAISQGGANDTHLTPAAQDTVDWRDIDGPGNLRVDYVLPSRDLDVRDTGVFWPRPGMPGYEAMISGDKAGTRHRLVWIDIK